MPRERLRVECLRCFRTVEIQRLDAVKLYGPHAILKDVGSRLLDDGCQHRRGRHEEDGCWPNWCACRKSNPDVFVMQSAEDWAAKNTPCPLNSTR
jgi:hypothetical protein